VSEKGSSKKTSNGDDNEKLHAQESWNGCYVTVRIEFGGSDIGFGSIFAHPIHPSGAPSSIRPAPGAASPIHSTGPASYSAPRAGAKAGAASGEPIV
jgi:hypothetical protein